MKTIKHPSLHQQFPIKMLVPALLAMVFFVFLVFAVLIPYFENALMDRKRELIHDLVVTAESSVQRSYDLYQAGKMTEEEAQAEALNQIRALRYGLNGENYFWIHDFEPIMLAHPIQALEGHNVSLLSEPIDNGRLVFAEMTDEVKQKGQAFLDYVWDAPGGDGVIPKISYSKEFEPWGWIIGTDISFEDIFLEISDIVKRLTVTIAIIMFCISGLLIYNVLTGVRSERNRQQAEQNLAISEEKFRTLVEHVPVGIYRNEKNPLGKCTMINPGFKEMFGFKTNRRAKSTSLGDLFYKESDAKIFEVALTELGEITDFEVRLKKAKKGYIWANLSARTVIEENGYTYYDGIIENITERKKAAMAQKRAFEKLKKLDKEKDEFIAVASHEMRTPLGVIKGYASLLLTKLNQNMGPSQTSLLGKIKGNVERLTGIVNDMLDVQKIEGGDQTKAHPVELNPFISQMVTDFQISAGEKNIALTYQENPKVGFAMGDEEKLKQIFNNLIGNAIKFVQEGGHIWVSAGEDPNSKDHLRVSVKDDGKGIPKKDQKRIFEKFQQVEDHTKHTETGTGLGLAICKKIVTQLFKGKIWVESKEGEGSDFLFTILKATKADITEYKKSQASIEKKEEAPKPVSTPPAPAPTPMPETSNDPELAKKKAEVLAKLAAASSEPKEKPVEEEKTESDADFAKRKAEVLAKLKVASFAPKDEAKTSEEKPAEKEAATSESSDDDFAKKKAEVLAKLAAAAPPKASSSVETPDDKEPEKPNAELSPEELAKKKAEVLAKLKNMK